MIVPNPIDPDDVVAPERHASDTGRVAYLGAPRRYKGFDLLPDIIEASQRLAAADWLVFSHQTDDDLDADVAAPARDGGRRAGVARRKVSRRPLGVRAM